MKKAQSAMEYLMTYGWAILIVIIVAAALFALGVFNPATYTQSAPTGFQGFQIPSGGFQLSSSGQLTLVLNNMGGATINITNISATSAGTLRYNTTYSNNIPSGGTYTYIIPNLPTLDQGSPYSVDVIITYTNLNTGLAGFTSTGTITGTTS